MQCAVVSHPCVTGGHCNISLNLKRQLYTPPSSEASASLNQKDICSTLPLFLHLALACLRTDYAAASSHNIGHGHDIASSELVEVTPTHSLPCVICLLLRIDGDAFL